METEKNLFNEEQENQMENEKEEEEENENKEEESQKKKKKIIEVSKPLWIEKYKPKRLEEFELNENFVNLFQRFIQKNIINVILVGQEGSGKSTMLETLVTEYFYPFSFLQYKENIMSMHALKEQSMQLFRKNEIKTFCQTCSMVEGKKKIMLLDDLDNMPEANQKYLMNMMEKYQRNVNFLASCNNLQKVAIGLQSRMMLIHLPNLQTFQMQNILSKILTNERYTMSTHARDLLITTSRNKVNILIHFLEKIHLYKLSTGGSREIDSSLVNEMTTILDFYMFDVYFGCLKDNKLKDAIDIIFQIVEQGFSVIDLLDSMFQYIKTTNTIEDQLKFSIIESLCKYTSFFYQIHEDDIELALLTNDIFKILSNPI